MFAVMPSFSSGEAVALKIQNSDILGSTLDHKRKSMLCSCSGYVQGMFTPGFLVVDLTCPSWVTEVLGDGTSSGR